MTSSDELRRGIEGCELQHSKFGRIHDYLARRIRDARGGFESRIEWVIGPSRVGKTMLIGALARMNPEFRAEGKRQVPVLVVPVSPNVSPVLLPASVLRCLGVPLRQRGISSGAMFGPMVDQLRLAQTRVLILEEASHLIEPGARVQSRAAGDWIKRVAEEGELTLLLFGVPRLKRLFESNEQLRLRASAAREFRPYDFRCTEDQMAFAACVRTYCDLFQNAGWRIEVPMSRLVPQCFLLSGGLVGVLSRFMQELAWHIAYEAPRVLTWEDCRLAASSMTAAGHPDFPAFHKSEVTAVEINASYAYVLESNEMSAFPSACSKEGA